MYSRLVTEHFLNPRNIGSLDAPDGAGQVGNPGEGQFAVIHVRVRDGQLAEARFRTFGCGPAIAACSLLTEQVTGKSVVEARSITAEQLIDLLGGLPPDRSYCAGLAVEALRRALDSVGESCGAAGGPAGRATRDQPAGNGR